MVAAVEIGNRNKERQAQQRLEFQRSLDRSIQDKFDQKGECDTRRNPSAGQSEHKFFHLASGPKGR